MAELKRINDVVVNFLYRTTCLRCGKAIKLWFNGGELDQRECCGLFYRLQSDRIDFVVHDGNDD